MPDYNLKGFTTSQLIALIPIIGIVLYLLTFSVAASEYPGGSINKASTMGYSFFHNFLCDVMNPITQSGAVNEARGMAIISHLILSLTMISFFYILPEIFSWKNRNTRIIRSMGMFTMGVFIFMFTPYHDTIVVLTAVFGTIALIPFFIEINKLEHKAITWLAYACYGFSTVVFISFQTKIGFYYLPLLQKFTFMLDAWWVIWVSLIVLKKQELPAYEYQNRS